MRVELRFPKQPLNKKHISCKGIEVYIDGKRQYGIEWISPSLIFYQIKNTRRGAIFDGDFKIVERVDDEYGRVDKLLVSVCDYDYWHCS